MFHALLGISKLTPVSEIVAFSKWVYPHTPDPNAEDLETAIRTQQHVPGSNDELVVEFFTKFLRGRRKWIVPETHYCSYCLTLSFVGQSSYTHLLMCITSHEHPCCATRIPKKGPWF
jgi:hypothetical protein